MRGLYRRGNVWWVRFSFAGKQHFVSTGEDDEARAIVVARRILDKPARITGGALKIEIQHYLDDLRRKGRKPNYVRNLDDRLTKIFLPAFRSSSLAAITSAHLQRWYDQTVQEVSGYSASAYFDDVRRFFKWALLHDKVRVNPCEGVKAPRPKARRRVNWQEPGITTRLIALCGDPELRYCLFCGADAGMRKDEVIMSRPEWFDLRRGTVRILRSEHWKWGKGEQRLEWSPKFGKERTIPLSDRFLCFLKVMYPLRHPYLISPASTMGRHRYRHDFYNRFRRYVKRQGVAMCFHDLRHSFASRLVQHDVSAFKVAEFLGDRVSEVERVYGHLRPYDRVINKGI